RILVPLDGSTLSDQILPAVTVLALAYGSKVTLLRVHPMVYTEVPSPLLTGPLWDEQAMRESLETQRQRLAEAGVQVEVRAVYGVEVAEILSAADDADLVRYLDDVTQSLGRTGLGESFDGLSCTTACEPDRYGEDVVEALGYAPLAFDRAVLVGEPPSSLTILQGGGVDPDDVVAAFDGDDGYRVEPAGRGVRITSDCAPRRTRCVEPGPRDELGRGVHVYVDDTWRAISVDPDAVDAFVARIDGGGDPLPTDAPERTVLAWADDLEVVSGQGWAPMAGQRCADDDLPDARAALAGTGARGAGDPAPVVLRVALTDDADADAAADAVEAATAEGAGCGSTSSIVSDYLEDLRVAVDGADVTLTATAADTVPARWPNAPADELPRGAIWTQLLLRADLPWSRPAQEGDEAGTSGTSGPGSPGSTGTSNIDGTGWGS
ncbi:MAG: universal stress protein, partial [Acidimicrobiales bacterium]|nr:universal stress protein [Acidimicrobiales bacterium]